MSLTIRPLTPADYARAVAIENTRSNDPETLESFRHSIETWPEGYPVVRLVAEEDGEVAAFGTAFLAPWLKPGYGMVGVTVDPSLRGRGIGRELYKALDPFWSEHKVEGLTAEVADNDAGALAWAERRGFVKRHHIFDSKMNPAEFDEASFPGVVDRILEQDYRFVSLADMRTEETERKLYDFHHVLLKDLPNAADIGQAPFEEWRKWMFTNPDAWVESMLIAVDPEGNWAGLTSMHRNSEEPHRAHIAFTGVERAHRGKQLALAIKLMGLRFAREHGITQIVTNNHSANAPMLAVNRKLGYVPLPGFFILWKTM